MNIQLNFPDLFGPGKLPELEAIIFATATSYPSKIPFLFNNQPMDREIYQTTTLSGLGNPTIKGEGVNTDYADIQPGFSQTYAYDEWTLGYRIGRNTVRDGKFSMIERATRSFAKGFYEVKEIAAANVFNNGFTVNGYDDVPLFSLVHPLEDGGGAVGINRPVDGSELSITSVRELRNILQSTIDENNRLIEYHAKYLVVPLDLQDVAKEIIKSAQIPDNANNAINTLYDAMQLLPGDYWSYLSRDSAFFIVTDKMDHHLMHLSRAPLETESEWKKDSRSREIVASESFTKGYSGWRGTTGNPGL